MQTFVNGTKVFNFGVEDFDAEAGINFIFSATDPPATDDRHKGTIWFRRGLGELLKWHYVNQPTATSDGGWVTEVNWVQLGGARRTNWYFNQRTCRHGDLLGLICEVSGGLSATPSGTISDAKFLMQRSIDEQYTPVMCATSPVSGHLGRNFVIDPIMIAQPTGGTEQASNYAIAADWGFVDAWVVGTGKFLCIGGALGTDTLTTQVFAQATSYSAAGDRVCIFGLLSESNNTNALFRKATIFKMPSITNLVHGPTP